MTERSKSAAGARRTLPVSPVTSARRDLLTGGIVVAAILMFVGTGSTFAHSVLNVVNGIGGSVDELLASTLLLNIALILFGWRRYRDLSREVARCAAAEDRAQILASRDPLTGLHNRRSLGEAASALLARADKRRKAVALLVLDLDHFKTVNDLHGHVAGDLLLRAAADTIEGAAPPSAVCARLGGDEFACAFLFDPANPSVIDVLAEQLVSRFSEPFNLGEVSAHVTVSIGIARSEPDCATFDGLMRRADIAMYAAKKLGRNRFAWFDASMERELDTRNAIESGLRSGIPLGQIVPYYEQQIDLTTGRLHGFEVLARWNHPTLGLIMPDLFIPIAEESGMIGDLSLSVMRQAFEEARNWDPALSLSVNISPGQLKDPWLAQKIVKLLVETGFPPSRLEIEITESSLYENLGLAQSIVSSLKNQGIRLALDDFGTGYSSLAHLRALPFDRIKIDKSFVMTMIDNSESAAIVNAISKLGESLNLPITAEGIEDAAIEARLRTMGCHKGQGWHFGKPLTVNQVRTLLATKSLLPSAREPAPDAVPTRRKRAQRDA
jgi:diguanylate cyclase (GGDEF)-like protein